MMQWVAGAVIAAVIAAAVCLWYKNKRMYQTIDQMLDELLNGERITHSDLREGQLSALAGKVMRIQEKIESEVSSAQAEKEQVKSLISNMSHQLKTPLANACMYCELAGTETEPERQKLFRTKTKKQLEKIDWILGSLFKMVRLEQGALVFDAQPASLQKTLLEAVNAVYMKAEKKGIAVITEPFADCRLLHNSKWTAEAFENILENAVKYTESGGEIRIAVNRMELYTEIQFSDNGIGIRQEELTDIFKRFYRSKDAEHQEGSGIGLYLARLILEKEKGYMTVKSEYGAGTCFSVFLQNCQN